MTIDFELLSKAKQLNLNLSELVNNWLSDYLEINNESLPITQEINKLEKERKTCESLRVVYDSRLKELYEQQAKQEEEAERLKKTVVENQEKERLAEEKRKREQELNKEVVFKYIEDHLDIKNMLFALKDTKDIVEIDKIAFELRKNNIKAGSKDLKDYINERL